MKTNRINTAPRDFPGAISQAFNLADATTSDGWRDAAELQQSAEDRQASARRQTDMFPDAEGYRPSSGGAR